MKTNYLLLFILFSTFTACLKSEFSLETEITNQIGFDNCPFYGFWADTLWCADEIIIEKLRYNEDTMTLMIDARTKKLVYDHYPFQYQENFKIIVENFKGIGKYSLNKPGYSNYSPLYLEILIFDLMGATFQLGYPYEEYTGEVIITAYDEKTSVIEGEVRGELINTFNNGDNLIQMDLRGGRFKGVIR